MKKAETALIDLKSLIYRSKIDNFDSILSLYYSLVRSVLSYCSPIWGLNFSDCFETLRIKFLKSLFLLPRTTPNWFVRLELNLKTSEIFFVKMCLKFWWKISNKSQDSLMFKAYNTFKSIQTGNYKKNWYQLLVQLCRKWGCSVVFDKSDTTSKQEFHQVLRDIGNIENDSISLDIMAMRNTKLLRVYYRNKTHCIKEKYLRETHAWSVKQLILQLKLGISHLTYKGKVAKLQCLEYKYGRVEDSKCQLCGQNVEDTFHLLFECPHYVIEREKYISHNFSYHVPYTRNNYLCLFNNLSKSDSMLLFYFFNCVLARRKLYLEDFMC